MAVARPVSWRSTDGLTLWADEYAPAGGGAGGCPVLCLPGLTRNARDYDSMAPWLAGRGRRVLALDFRGRGRSEYDSVPRRYRPPVYAADVEALCLSLGVGRVHLVGTSLGGLVAMELAARGRVDIGAAVLNDIGPEVNRAGLARIASYAGKTRPVETWDDAVAYVRTIGAPTYPAFSDADWHRMAERTFRGGPDGRPVLDYDPAIFRPIPAWALPILERLLWRRFRRLASGPPTLVLRGAVSDLLDRRTVARMRASVPTLMTAEIPDVGHAPSLDEPASRAALAAFFDLQD